MVTIAPIFEALRVLHNLYKMGKITFIDLRNYLREQYDVEITVLTNGEIKAESQDGKHKYLINQ